MTKLNQLLAVEKGVSQRAQRQLTDAYHLIQRSQLFHGLSRTYQPKDDEGEHLPSESTRVQQSVAALVAELTTPFARLLDVQFEKDSTNLVARADVVVDGVTLLRAAPVTYLLWLEKRLNDIKTFAEKWPVLDAAERWTYDPANSVFATDGVGTLRTTKVPTPIIKAPATEKHPAQVDMYNRDVTVGTWTTVKLSGATEPSRKQETLDRIDKVLAAVRAAREEANAIDVVSVTKPGRDILDFVFQPVTA